MSFSDADADFQRLIETNHTNQGRLQAYQQLKYDVKEERNRRIQARNEIMRDYGRYIPLVNNQPSSVQGEPPLITMMANAEEQADTDEEESGGDYIEVDTANRLRERASQSMIEISNYRRRMLDLVNYNKHLFVNLTPPAVPATIAPPPLPF